MDPFILSNQSCNTLEKKHFLRSRSHKGPCILKFLIFPHKLTENTVKSVAALAGVWRRSAQERLLNMIPKRFERGPNLIKPQVFLQCMRTEEKPFFISKSQKVPYILKFLSFPGARKSMENTVKNAEPKLSLVIYLLIFIPNPESQNSSNFRIVFTAKAWNLINNILFLERWDVESRNSQNVSLE